MKSIFELLENLNLVLAKLNPELGTAQPQLVILFMVRADFKSKRL